MSTHRILGLEKVPRVWLFANMHDQEEELTILGSVITLTSQDSEWSQEIKAHFRHTLLTTEPQHAALRNTPSFDPCCEITTMRELGKDFHCSHRGITLPREKYPTIIDLIHFRALSTIKRAFTLYPLFKRQAEQQFDPLNVALIYAIITQNPKKGMQYKKIINFLIKYGFYSDQALHLAILCNERELIRGLISLQPCISAQTLQLTKMQREPLQEIEKIVLNAMSPEMSERKKETALLTVFSKYFGKKRAPVYCLYSIR